MDMSVPMQSSDFFSDHTRLHGIMFSDDVEVGSFASTITKSTYHPVSISTFVDTQKHLSVEDREILSTMLNKHTVLFDGILKSLPTLTCSFRYHSKCNTMPFTCLSCGSAT